MADSLFDGIQTRGKGVKLLAASFAPNGASAVNAASRKGRGFTITRVSTGRFQLKLSHKYVALLSLQGQVQLAVPSGKIVIFGAADAVSTGLIDLYIWDTAAGALADIAADPANRIHVNIVVSNSTLNK